ncbi:MAG: hypothetical protein MI920_11470 [Kiloniellales bacterium]|nr:hypothetical protein [Kiloniellales bacterium]
MLYACTTIGQDQLSAVQALEKEIGKPLLALSPIEADPAPVGEQDLAKIRALEDKLGMVLVAVDN